MVPGKELCLAYPPRGTSSILHLGLRFKIVTAERWHSCTVSKCECRCMTSLDLYRINTTNYKWRSNCGLRELSKPFILQTLYRKHWGETQNSSGVLLGCKYLNCRHDFLEATVTQGNRKLLKNSRKSINREAIFEPLLTWMTIFST